LLLLIIILIVLFGAGGYPAWGYGDGRYRGPYFGGVGLILIIVLIVWLIQSRGGF
jgi:hypothetical protein